MKRSVDDALDASTVQFSTRLLLSHKEAGLLIGKGGANIKDVRESSSTQIKVEQAQMVVAGNYDSRLVTITGFVEGITYAVGRIYTLDQEEGGGDPSVGPAADRAARCLISKSQSGRVIGKGGSKVNHIRNDSGATVKIVDLDPNDSLVSVNGPAAAVVQALQMVVKELAEHAVEKPEPKRSAPPPAQPMMPPPAVHHAAAAWPYAPLQTPYGALSPAGFAPQPLSTLPQPVSGPAHAGVVSAEAAPPPATLEQMLSHHSAGCLIGRGGAGIREVRSMCRAKIELASEPEGGHGLRRLTITGSLEDIYQALGSIMPRLPASLPS